jgi:hypothetical protein
MTAELPPTDAAPPMCAGLITTFNDRLPSVETKKRHPSEDAANTAGANRCATPFSLRETRP